MIFNENDNYISEKWSLAESSTERKVIPNRFNNSSCMIVHL